MQLVLSKIWTRIAVSISCDDNHYPTVHISNFWRVQYILTRKILQVFILVGFLLQSLVSISFLLFFFWGGSFLLFLSYLLAWWYPLLIFSGICRILFFSSVLIGQFYFSSCFSFSLFHYKHRSFFQFHIPFLYLGCRL